MQSLRRPYAVTIPMVALVMLVPLYLVIADVARNQNPSTPATALDTFFPLYPAWSLVYGSLYAFLIVLPVLVVRQPEHIRHTVHAYLSVWVISYGVFLVYPTVAPRPEEVLGDGFGVWGLRFLYGADPPYNCFPSIHVAHSFVSALTLHRVHKRLGLIALFCATLVALSTLYTKQHYVVDVIVGMLLALGAYAVFIKQYPRERISHNERQIAAFMAIAVLVVIVIAVAGFWAAYTLGT